MLYTTLRMVHILLGMFFTCSMLFLFFILRPALKRARIPAAPVMRAIPVFMVPIMVSSLVVVLGTGTAMTVTLRGWPPNSLLTTAWGWSVLISFLATLAIVVGVTIVAPSGFRLARLDRLTRGRTLTAEEIQEFNRLTRRFFGVANTSIMYAVSFTALVTMLILRYL